MYTVLTYKGHRKEGGCLSITSQSATAYQQIKDMIFRMELLPGARIPELQISAKLSISRTPIHDALRRLESEGLVTIGHNRGATVACFTDDEIKEIGAIRLSQDILSAQLASYYGSASDFDDLDRLADDCEAAASKGDIYGRIKTDCNFHLAISKISGNSHLISQQYAIYQQIHLVQVSKYTDIEHSLLQIHHHKPIISAMRSGNLEDVRALICQHIKDFYHIDPYLLKCYDGTSRTANP
ncbi:GntR family transcriptional regulator [Caproicibacter sp. BJN0012]|uniref:GntR family transcriptional regulator n=1 Tax=Acutalibacteraceae TaxID=3082771 RepID=UPI0026B2F006